MKKTHITIIVIVAVAIGALIATMGSSSTYSDFMEASKNPDTEYHVVGKCDKAKGNEYNPAVNTDEFTFYLVDNKGVEKKVVLHKNKPQDFDRSEQIVIIGKMQGDEFHAKDILMKCPSKYNDSKPTETRS
ncbi:MAG TPA: cytochrome c maturation protein CcmE [Bacteroidia bacterium]|jgi:cytochrome c-type biogenesis protein CcmE|nr:cytochrome c maturation protein CcmE [Bacteroidia bacterium]